MRKTYIAPALLLIVMCLAKLVPIAQATDAWTGAVDPTYEQIADQPVTPRCTNETVTIDGGQTATACMYDEGNWRYGTASWKVANWMGSYDTYKEFVVGFSADRKVYQVTNFSADSPVSAPNSNDLLFTYRNPSYQGYYLEVVKDFINKLQWHVDPSTLVRTYELAPNSIEYLLKDSSGSTTGMTMRGVGISQNGKWLVTAPIGAGIVRINLTDYSMKRFSAINPPYGQGADPSPEFAISNDGTHVISTGQNMPFHSFLITDTCGQNLQLTDDYYWTQSSMSPCPEKELKFIIPNYQWGMNPRFDDQADVLTLQVRHYTGADKWYQMIMPGYTMPPQLDYLAMGDSYSSGEGDLDKMPGGERYYLPGTNVAGDYSNNIPEEKCHISSRSYPFLLAEDMNLSSARMKSVACSGAVMNDMIGDSEYDGQFSATRKGPRLQGLTNISQLQDDARSNFLPGRVRQAEFVERNNPKVITLTNGGNDVDFADRLKTCIFNSPISDCSQTTERGKANLGQQIKGEYPKLLQLYQEMRRESPESKIYVLGYPQFVTNQDNFCALNIPLNVDERTMVVEGVSYLNSVIKAAANDAGVMYINIEDSFKGATGTTFDGHKLCEQGEQYVNGITDLGTLAEESELFHPNAKGHQAIFNTIKSGLGNQTLLGSPSCNQVIVCSNGLQVGQPVVPSYFASPMSTWDSAVDSYQLVKNSVQTAATHGVAILKKGVNWLANTAPQTVEPDTSVDFVINSDPVDLGSYTTNADGSVSATITIPSSVAPGFHMLHMYGKTYSGENVDLYQIVEVQGADGDVDENGVPDNQQQCLYMTPSGTDADFDGIDDACDPDVSSTPQLYRVRNGNTANGEQANYLYIERNTRAGSMTGVNNDDDPDDDGWAVVGASQGSNDTGTPANFWVDSSNVPHVAVRTAENGCEQYTPADLSRVMPLTTRTLSQESTNTSTCRIEPATNDTDSDGQPDNTQPLYQARNGDSTKGEDPGKIYIERSTRAAEAQLHLSDYATFDQTSPYLNGDQRNAWSLLASSQDLLTSGTFKKLVMVNSDPVILVEDSSHQCQALKPTSLTVIQQSTQQTRGLELTSMPQGGSCE